MASLAQGDEVLEGRLDQSTRRAAAFTVTSADPGDVTAQRRAPDPARTTPWFRIAWPRLTAEGWIDDTGPRTRG